MSWTKTKLIGGYNFLMAGFIPEEPGGFQLPFRHLQPDSIKAPQAKPRPPGRKRAGPGRSWMAELLFEQSIVSPPSPVQGDDRGSGQAGGGGAYTRGQLADGYIGEEPPKTFAQYRALMCELFDGKRDKVVGLLKREAVFNSAIVEWTPKRSTTNANIARQLTPYVVKAMETVYDYAAPPIEYVPAAGFLGTYDMKAHKIQITPVLFTLPLKEFIDTLIHEEIHAFQAEWMLMLNTQMRGKVLAPPERAIARYWRNEEPKYRSALAAGSQMSPDTKRRYRMIGQEYHAWTTGHYISTKVLGG